MSVRYKFKNDLQYSHLSIDGVHISVKDLKKSIVEHKKFDRVTDFDLVVTESGSGDQYDKDDDLILKNTSLIIARHPLPQGQKKVWYDEEKVPKFNSSNQEILFKNLANANLTEDEKLGNNLILICLVKIICSWVLKIVNEMTESKSGLFVAVNSYYNSLCAAFCN